MKAGEPLSDRNTQRLTEKLRKLSPSDRCTVEDFVDFLHKPRGGSAPDPRHGTRF